MAMRQAHVVFSLFFILCACDLESAKTIMQKDKERYPLLSLNRPIGASCGPNDSASIKRRDSHPLGPAGGWSAESAIQVTRTRDVAEPLFGIVGGQIRGYVIFPVAGELRIRSYDDLYGSVYCGWSTKSLAYRPTPSAVYVSFEQCAVGDGGLDQVHEVCWFPQGEETGVILFSTERPPKTQLRPQDIYTRGSIGKVFGPPGKVAYFFDRHQADIILDGLLQEGRVAEALAEVQFALDHFQYLPKVIEGVAGKEHSSFKAHRDAWLSILLRKAGLEIREKKTADTLQMVSEVIAEANDDLCFDCKNTEDMLPLYRWIHQRLLGEMSEVPQPSSRKRRVQGQDPFFIAGILANPMKTDTTIPEPEFLVGGETTYFWLGIREYLAANQAEARRYLNLYRKEPNKGFTYFTLAVAAALVQGRA